MNWKALVSKTKSRVGFRWWNVETPGRARYFTKYLWGFLVLTVDLDCRSCSPLPYTLFNWASRVDLEREASRALWLEYGKWARWEVQWLQSECVLHWVVWRETGTGREVDVGEQRRGMLKARWAGWIVTPLRNASQNVLMDCIYRSGEDLLALWI